ncbi:MAG: hypothetical protein M3O31_14700 [Acidobacteriota bacterium]|nr:hypothetical protein [Acidobacteriota bacterium]
MTIRTKKSVVLFAGVAMAVGMLAGCRVEKTTNGDSKNVQIVTPFGGMNVKTNDANSMEGIGLPSYPGAVAVNKDDDNHKSADVDMSFGGFKLRVKVASFHSDDPAAKVEAFYRNGMKEYGDVIACQHNQPMGSPAKTGEGLTCSNNSEKGHVTVYDSTSSHRMELKAGSEQHQHLVTIDPDGTGTKFSLVALDLPGKISYDGDTDTDKRQ